MIASGSFGGSGDGKIGRDRHCGLLRCICNSSYEGDDDKKKERYTKDLRVHNATQASLVPISDWTQGEQR
jgi:hypothetical protein